MKKILSIIGVLSLTTISSITVIACTTKKEGPNNKHNKPEENFELNVNLEDLDLKKPDSWENLLDNFAMIYSEENSTKVEISLAEKEESIKNITKLYKKYINESNWKYDFIEGSEEPFLAEPGFKIWDVSYTNNLLNSTEIGFSNHHSEYKTNPTERIGFDWERKDWELWDLEDDISFIKNGKEITLKRDDNYQYYKIDLNSTSTSIVDIRGDILPKIPPGKIGRTRVAFYEQDSIKIDYLFHRIHLLNIKQYADIYVNSIKGGNDKIRINIGGYLLAIAKAKPNFFKKDSKDLFSINLNTKTTEIILPVFSSTNMVSISTIEFDILDKR